MNPKDSVLKDPLFFALGLVALSLIVTFFIVFYFLPSAVAYFRDHRNFMSIVIVNAFFGWSVLGWALSLAWAFSADVREQRH